MKTFVRASILIAALAIIMLAVGAVAPALAQTTTTFTGFSVGEANIRSAPGVNAGVIGVLPPGEQVTAIGRNVGNNWIQIQMATTTGWVASWLTVYSGDTILLPAVSDDNPEPSERDQQGPFIVSSPYNVNIRSGPDIDANILTVMPFTGEATALARVDSSNWLKIKYKTTTGWVAKWRVILSADVNALPVEGASTGGGGSPSLPTTPGIPPLFPSPGPKTTPSAPPTSLPAGSITIQAPSRANVRSAPSITASVLDIISFTDEAVVIGQTAGHNWLQVKHNGTTGWVARWVVITSEDTSAVSVTSPSNDVTPAPGGLVSGKGIYDVFVRSGPSLNNGQVAVLPAYTSVPLLTRTEESNWVKIDFQGTQGWVAAWIIVATSDINNLPVETP